MPHRAAAVALFDMTAKRGGATGDDGAPCLGLAAAKPVPGQPSWPVHAQDIGQFDVAGAGHGLMPGAQARKQASGESALATCARRCR